MATLYVSYLAGSQYGVAKSPSGTTTITTSGTTAKSSANTGSAIAVVFSDAAHYVNVGPSASVTASATNGLYVPANTEREFALNSGDEIAAITA